MSASQGTFPQNLYSQPGTPAFRSAWQDTIKAADEADDPGHFTAFIGYEWNSNTELKTPEMLQYEYARSGLKLGLKLEQELGTNPYKFGMIGSTDSHTGLATADEDDYFGKTSAMEPNPERISRVFVKAEKAAIYDWETSASGYAAVWARENTRETLFDAMERRETYATTGKPHPVGSTVDVANAIWTNTIGDPELITLWRDPEFNPTQRAFYYARILEIPTPRWTAYDAKYFGVQVPREVPMILQERAYTSPIWYTPG